MTDLSQNILRELVDCVSVCASVHGLCDACNNNFEMLQAAKLSPVAATVHTAYALLWKILQLSVFKLTVMCVTCLSMLLN